MNNIYLTPDEVLDLTRQTVERGGFASFVRLAWDKVCPEPLVWNWHMEEICTELEQIALDRYQDLTSELAVCVPPSSSKSLLVSVLWQPWVWTWWPESRWITCTYEQSLAGYLSGVSLDLFKSRWYQALWPTPLVKGAERHWANGRGGWRRALGTGGAITGTHAHFHIGDDLIKEQDSRQGTSFAIASSMAKANSFWFVTLITRKVSQAVARVLVGQRLHVDDPPGVAIKKHGYKSLVFPMEYVVAAADPRDHRSSEGELLCEARCDKDGVKSLERSLGPSAASGQLQQNPIQPGGQMIKPDYLSVRYWTIPGKIKAYLDGSGDPEGGMVCGIYGDMTFKGKVTSDYVVYQLWVSYLNEYWLIDQVRGQWGFEESKRQLIDFVERHPAARYVKLEDAANAPAIVDELSSTITGLQLIPISGGCLARQQLIEGIWATYAVHLPARAPWMGGSDGFVAEHLTYDGLGTRHDDQVATSGLAILDLSGRKTKSYSSIWGDSLSAR